MAALKKAGGQLAEVDYHRLEAGALTTTVEVLARVASQIAAATAAATDAALTTGTVRSSGAATATQWLVDTGGGSARKARRTAGRATS